jgi:hypothetical protein
MLRVPFADGTLVASPDDLIPSLLAASDVFGTGWHAADGANVKPGKTVAVVGGNGLAQPSFRPPSRRSPSDCSASRFRRVAGLKLLCTNVGI